MKRENKAYSYKEQIIELELQEVKFSVHYLCIYKCLQYLDHILASVLSCRS